MFCGNKLLLLWMTKISTANFFALFFQANFFKEGRRKIPTFHHCRSAPRYTYQRFFHFIVNKTERKFCPWPLPNPQPEAFIHGTEGSTFLKGFHLQEFSFNPKNYFCSTANFTWPEIRTIFVLHGTSELVITKGKHLRKRWNCLHNHLYFSLFVRLCRTFIVIPN